VCPYAKHADRARFGEDFIHQAVLDSDAAGIRAREIPDQLSTRRGILEGVTLKNSRQFERPGFEAA
jgi:hypothetical protein